MLARFEKRARRLIRRRSIQSLDSIAARAGFRLNEFFRDVSAMLRLEAYAEAEPRLKIVARAQSRGNRQPGESGSLIRDDCVAYIETQNDAR